MHNQDTQFPPIRVEPARIPGLRRRYAASRTGVILSKAKDLGRKPR
jgi:hypothetical protein